MCLLCLLRLLCVGRGERIHRERQIASELTGQPADLTAQLRIAEDRAERTAHGLANLSQQIAKETLRRQLSQLCQLSLSLLNLLSLLCLLCLL